MSWELNLGRQGEKKKCVERKVNSRECEGVSCVTWLYARLHNHEADERTYNSISTTSGWMNRLPGVSCGWGKESGK